MRAAVEFKHLESGHVYEWRLDFDSTGNSATQLAPGTSVGIDIVVGDKDEDGSFSWMAWGRGTVKSSSVERLGDALLVESERDIGTISGTVTAQASGEPYGGLAVEARRDQNAAGSARSDSDGRYQLMLLPGEYSLRPTDGQGVRPFEVSDIVVRAGEETPVDLAIEPPGRIAGTVTRSQDEPYANLVLEAFRDGDQTARGRTDDNGHYQFGGLTPGEYALRPAAGQGVTPFEITGIAVSAGEETTTDFDAIPRPYQASLQVRLPAGLSDNDIRTVIDRVDSLTAALELTTMAEGSDSRQAAPHVVSRQLELSAVDDLNAARRALRGNNSWKGLLGDTDWALRLVAGPWGAGHSTSAGEGQSRPAGSGRRLGEADLADIEITALLQTGAGQLWAATEGTGVLRQDGDHISVFRTDDGLIHDYTRSLLRDADGALWIGTDGTGLCRYHKARFTAYTTADGLPHNVVTALAQDDQGNLWIGTEGGGLCRYDGHDFTVYETADGLPSDWIVSLLIAADGALWVGTEDAGAVRISGESFTNIGTGDGLGHDWVGACVV